MRIWARNVHIYSETLDCVLVFGQIIGQLNSFDLNCVSHFLLKKQVLTDVRVAGGLK
jgi:hypothetical protein